MMKPPVVLFSSRRLQTNLHRDDAQSAGGGDVESKSFLQHKIDAHHGGHHQNSDRMFCRDVVIN